MPEAESRSRRGEAQEQAGTADGERKGQIQKALVSETRIRQLPHPNAVISIPDMFLCRLDGSARRTAVQASNVTGQRLHLRASLVSLDYQITLSCSNTVACKVQLRNLVFLAQLPVVDDSLTLMDTLPPPKPVQNETTGQDGVRSANNVCRILLAPLL